MIKNYGQAVDFLQVNLGSKRISGPPMIRMGKTRKDKTSGAYDRRMVNNAQRATWSNEQDRLKRAREFPLHTCNGHRYRRRIKHDTKSQPQVA